MWVGNRVPLLLLLLRHLWQASWQMTQDEMSYSERYAGRLRMFLFFSIVHKQYMMTENTTHFGRKASVLIFLQDHTHPRITEKCTFGLHYALQKKVTEYVMQTLWWYTQRSFVTYSEYPNATTHEHFKIVCTSVNPTHSGRPRSRTKKGIKITDPPVCSLL